MLGWHQPPPGNGRRFFLSVTFSFSVIPVSQRSRLLFVLMLLLGAALRPGWAQAPLAPGAAGSAPLPPALELRGIMVDGLGPVFALHDASTQRSGWVRLHESFEGYTITAYHPGADSITVESSRTQATLALRPRGTAAGSAAESAGAGPVLPPDQQQRLEELAAEVKRLQSARLAGTLVE